MKVKFNSRDVKVFLLGIVVAFSIYAIYNWEENVQAFKEGYSLGQDFLGKSD